MYCQNDGIAAIISSYVLLRMFPLLYTKIKQLKKLCSQILCYITITEEYRVYKDSLRTGCPLLYSYTSSILDVNSWT